MPRPLRFIPILIALGLIGCGDDGSDAQSGGDGKQSLAEQLEQACAEHPNFKECDPNYQPPKPAPAPPKEAAPTKGGGFTGIDASNYETAKSVCGAFSKEKVARDLGLPASADEVTIAEEYASGYRPAFQQANFEGCLEGLGVP